MFDMETYESGNAETPGSSQPEILWWGTCMVFGLHRSLRLQCSFKSTQPFVSAEIWYFWWPQSHVGELKANLQGLRIKEGKIFHEDCHTSILSDLPIRAEIISTFYTVGMPEGPRYPTQPSLFTGEDNRSPMRGGDIIWQWKGDSALGSQLQLQDSCLAPCHGPNSLTLHGSDYWNVVHIWQS